MSVWRNRVGLQSIEIGGVWLRSKGTGVEVLVELPDGWHLCITDSLTGLVSHIVEPDGIATAPIDGKATHPKIPPQGHPQGGGTLL